MKRRIHHKGHLAPALLLGVLLLATACDSGTGALHESPEAVPGAFTITSRQVAVSATRLEGTFEASGMLDDRGTVREVVDSSAPLHQRGSISGVKTLESEKGTIEITFYAGLSRVDPITLRALGGFCIEAGTGAYADLAGGGEIDLEVAASASLADVTRVLVGVAEYAR